MSEETAAEADGWEIIPYCYGCLALEPEECTCWEDERDVGGIVDDEDDADDEAWGW